jgi:hypothetical protein
MSRRQGLLKRTYAVGVTIPVNNEEALLGEALAALEACLEEIASDDLQVGVAVVLDSCSDASGDIARRWKYGVESKSRLGVTLVECDAHSAGRARALGCVALLDQFHDVSDERIWLATTDADSRVPRNWLHAQINEHEHGADVWAGRVSVAEWSTKRAHVARTWQWAYDHERHPIHGANLGFNAEQYLLVGGFQSLVTGEDRALLAALTQQGAVAHFDSSTQVVTSDRRIARAPDGFASVLIALDHSLNRDATSLKQRPAALAPVSGA